MAHVCHFVEKEICRNCTLSQLRQILQEIVVKGSGHDLGKIICHFSGGLVVTRSCPPEQSHQQAGGGHFQRHADQVPVMSSQVFPSRYSCRVQSTYMSMSRLSCRFRARISSQWDCFSIQYRKKPTNRSFRSRSGQNLNTAYRWQSRMMSSKSDRSTSSLPLKYR